MSTDNGEIDIQVEQIESGKPGRVLLTVREGEELIHRDQVQLGTASARDKFAKAVADKTGMDAEEIERRLLECSDEIMVAGQRHFQAVAFQQQARVARIFGVDGIGLGQDRQGAQPHVCQIADGCGDEMAQSGRKFDFRQRYHHRGT